MPAEAGPCAKALSACVASDELMDFSTALSCSNRVCRVRAFFSSIWSALRWSQVHAGGSASATPPCARNAAPASSFVAAVPKGAVRCMAWSLLRKSADSRSIIRRRPSCSTHASCCDSRPGTAARSRGSHLEIAVSFQIGQQPGLRRLPRQLLARSLAGGRAVAREEVREPPEVRRGLRGGHAQQRQFQTAPDRGSDVAGRYAFLGNPVEPGSRGPVLDCLPEQTGGVQTVHRGPPVQPVADVRRYPLLARDADERRNEAVIAVAVHRRRETHDRRAHTARCRPG